MKLIERKIPDHATKCGMYVSCLAVPELITVKR